MSEQHAEHRKPKGHAKLSELTLLVVVPGTPPKVQAYTEDQRSEAQAFAAKHDVEVRELPSID